MKRVWGIILSVLVLSTGCSLLYKPLRIDTTTQSYTQIRQAAIKALPLGLMWTSTNGRELRSKYFQHRGQDNFVDAIQNPVRHFAQITILNERRPYVVEILVLAERLDGGKYKVVGQDERLANLIKDRFLVDLAKRREDRNIIDDFRVF